MNAPFKGHSLFLQELKHIMSKLLFISTFIMLLFSCENTTEIKEGNTDEKVEIDQVKNNQSELSKLNANIIADPNNYIVYTNRANYYIANGEYDKAREDANRALRLNPNEAEVAYTKGVVLLKTNQIKEAITFFEHAVDIDSAHARSYLKLAYINLAVPDFDKSIEQINKALRINKYLAEGYFIKGMWYERQGKDELASSSYQTAIERKPDYYEAYLMQGALNDRLDNPLAIQYFNTAIRIKPKSIEAWRMKAISYKDHEQYEDALASFDSIIAINPNFEVAYFDKGATLLQMCFNTNPKETNDSLINAALVNFNKAITINNNYIPARYNRGLCYEDLGLKEKARKEYNEVLAIEPNYELAVKGLNRL